MAALTKRQAQILKYIKGYIEEVGYSPTLPEIGRAHMFSPNAAKDHVLALAKKGALSVTAGIPRSIVLTKGFKVRIKL